MKAKKIQALSPKKASLLHSMLGSMESVYTDKSHPKFNRHIRERRGSIETAYPDKFKVNQPPSLQSPIFETTGFNSQKPSLMNTGNYPSSLNQLQQPGFYQPSSQMSLQSPNLYTSPPKNSIFEQQMIQPQQNPQQETIIYLKKTNGVYEFDDNYQDSNHSRSRKL